jgi:hypothetical protein
MRTSILTPVLTLLAMLVCIHFATVHHLVAEDDDNGVEVSERQLEGDLLEPGREESDFRLLLASGRAIEVGKIFAEQREAMERSLSRSMRSRKQALLRINHQGSDHPLLLASRRGDRLDGPFASFTEDGSPVAVVDYKKGERDSALLTWDDAGRPIVFAQYQSGQLHGLRCLFKACCDNCKSGHLWMVQEWDQGQLLTAHIVDPGGTTISHEYRYGQPPPDSDVDSALAELASFEGQFDSDEGKLKELLKQYHVRQRQTAALRTRLASSQQRERLAAAAYGMATRSYRHLSPARTRTRRV